MGPRAQACHSIKGSKGSTAESVAACGKWATAILAHHLWAITGSVGQLQSVSHFMIISQIAKCWLNFNSFLQPGTRPAMAAAAIVGTNQLSLPVEELCVKGVIACSDGSRETAESIQKGKGGPTAMWLLQFLLSASIEASIVPSLATRELPRRQLQDH